MILQKQLLQRASISVVIMHTEVQKRKSMSVSRLGDGDGDGDGDGLAPVYSAVKNLLRGSGGNRVLNGADITAQSRLLPIFQDPNAFSMFH